MLQRHQPQRHEIKLQPITLLCYFFLVLIHSVGLKQVLANLGHYKCLHQKAPRCTLEAAFYHMSMDHSDNIMELLKQKISIDLFVFSYKGHLRIMRLQIKKKKKKPYYIRLQHMMCKHQMFCGQFSTQLLKQSIYILKKERIVTCCHYSLRAILEYLQLNPSTRLIIIINHLLFSEILLMFLCFFVALMVL